MQQRGLGAPADDEAVSVSHRRVTVCNRRSWGLESVSRYRYKVRMQESVPTILIVEDDSEIRRLVADLMRNAGFNVAEAEDAVGMDAILTHTRPDLVIL